MTSLQVLESGATSGTPGCTEAAFESPPEIGDTLHVPQGSHFTCWQACTGHLGDSGTEGKAPDRTGPDQRRASVGGWNPHAGDRRGPGPGQLLGRDSRRQLPQPRAHVRTRCAVWARAHREAAGAAHKGVRTGRAGWAPGAREANLQGPLRAARVGPGPPAMGARRGAGTSFPHGSAHPSPLLSSLRPLESERRGRGARPGHAFRCIVMRREARRAGGGAWLVREAGAGPAAARPRLVLHPQKAGHAPRRCGAGTGRGPSLAGPAPYLNIDAARVGVALLPLSEAVSRGPASA